MPLSKTYALHRFYAYLSLLVTVLNLFLRRYEFIGTNCPGTSGTVPKSELMSCVPCPVSRMELTFELKCPGNSYRDNSLPMIISVNARAASTIRWVELTVGSCVQRFA